MGRSPELAFELGGGETILESLDAVDGDDWYLKPVKFEQRRVGFDVDLRERIFVSAIG